MTIAPIVFLMLIMLIALYSLAGCIDITIAHAWQRRKKFYPMLEFTCFCGWHQSLRAGMVPIPNQCYNLHRVITHMKTCLVWMFNADFNGLTPYWANSYAEDLREYKDKPSRFLTPEYFLKAAKRRSARVKAGADPFDDSFEEMDDDQKRRKGYKI